MRIATVLLLGLMAAAPGIVFAGDSYAFGNRVLVIGDSTGKLVELAGSPDHKEPIENTFGAQEGERWEYRREGKSVLVTVQDGKVAQIDEVF